MMQHIINPRDSFRAHMRVSDISLNHSKPSILIGGQQLTDLVEVTAMASRKIVESDDVLVEPQEGFEQIRSDETGYPRYKPTARPGAQLRFGRLIVIHHRHPPLTHCTQVHLSRICPTELLAGMC